MITPFEIPDNTCILESCCKTDKGDFFEESPVTIRPVTLFEFIEFCRTVWIRCHSSQQSIHFDLVLFNDKERLIF